uniref:Uncharacterized protein n=1 Tax=viral metagenome TaxID=1070528 RepID=A0A6M3LPH5_9ZZZZ
MPQITRCEGWTRRGGAFTFGPVTWHQCKNDATVIIKFKQKKEDVTTLPSCLVCWQKCMDAEHIKILSVEPIKETP